MPESYQQAEERAKFTQRYDEFVDGMWTAHVDHREDVIRCTLGIVGEGGEIAEKVKKMLRGDKPLDSDDIIRELGDVLFYIVKMAHLHRASLRDVINANVEKLASRRERGVIKGSGDNR